MDSGTTTAACFESHLSPLLDKFPLPPSSATSSIHAPTCSSSSPTLSTNNIKKMVHLSPSVHHCYNSGGAPLTPPPNIPLPEIPSHAKLVKATLRGHHYYGDDDDTSRRSSSSACSTYDKQAYLAPHSNVGLGIQLPSHAVDSLLLATPSTNNRHSSSSTPSEGYDMPTSHFSSERTSICSQADTATSSSSSSGGEEALFMRTGKRKASDIVASPSTQSQYHTASHQRTRDHRASVSSLNAFDDLLRQAKTKEAEAAAKEQAEAEQDLHAGVLTPLSSPHSFNYSAPPTWQQSMPSLDAAISRTSSAAQMSEYGVTPVIEDTTNSEDEAYASEEEEAFDLSLDVRTPRDRQTSSSTVLMDTTAPDSSVYEQRDLFAEIVQLAHTPPELHSRDCTALTYCSSSDTTAYSPNSCSSFGFSHTRESTVTDASLNQSKASTVTVVSVSDMSPVKALRINKKQQQQKQLIESPELSSDEHFSMPQLVFSPGSPVKRIPRPLVLSPRLPTSSTASSSASAPTSASFSPTTPHQPVWTNDKVNRDDLAADLDKSLPVPPMRMKSSPLLQQRYQFTAARSLKLKSEDTLNPLPETASKTPSKKAIRAARSTPLFRPSSLLPTRQPPMPSENILELAMQQRKSSLPTPILPMRSAPTPLAPLGMPILAPRKSSLPAIFSRFPSTSE